MREIEDVGLQPWFAGIHLWHKACEHGCHGIKSQICQYTGEHVDKADGNPQTIAHGCTSVFHYLGYN